MIWIGTNLLKQFSSYWYSYWDWDWDSASIKSAFQLGIGIRIRICIHIGIIHSTKKVHRGALNTNTNIIRIPIRVYRYQGNEYQYEYEYQYQYEHQYQYHFFPFQLNFRIFTIWIIMGEMMIVSWCLLHMRIGIQIHTLSWFHAKRSFMAWVDVSLWNLTLLTSKSILSKSRCHTIRTMVEVKILFFGMTPTQAIKDLFTWWNVIKVTQKGYKLQLKVTRYICC